MLSLPLNVLWYRHSPDSGSGLRNKEKPLIKHVLDSGLVIEVESSGCGRVSESPAKFASDVGGRTSRLIIRA